jgi:hypothetical protein
MDESPSLEIINCRDLYKKQYTMDILEHNINNLQIKIILHTQLLSADFCAKYILDESQCTCNEDVYLIDFWYVLHHQPHITEAELDRALDKFS